MATSHATTHTTATNGGTSTCGKCGHGNATARITRTLFRRRAIVECGHMEEAVSGMAGADVCLCRGPAHQTLLA